VADRRPLATRDTAPAQRLAAWLIARRVRPNGISFVGMLAGIAGGLLLAATAWWPDARMPLWLGAAAMVQMRLLCNMLDGMVAVGSGRSSPTGELWNEIPDRVSDSATLIGLGYAAGGLPWLGYTAALLAMATAYVRATGKAAGAPSDFRGPMAKPHRMFTVTVLALYLGVCPRSWAPDLGGWQLPAIVLLVIAIGSALTALRRLLGIAAHLQRASS